MSIVDLATCTEKARSVKDRSPEAISDDVRRIFKIQKEDAVVEYQGEACVYWYPLRVLLLY